MSQLRLSTLQSQFEFEYSRRTSVSTKPERGCLRTSWSDVVGQIPNVVRSQHAKEVVQQELWGTAGVPTTQARTHDPIASDGAHYVKVVMLEIDAANKQDNEWQGLKLKNGIKETYTHYREKQLWVWTAEEKRIGQASRPTEPSRNGKWRDQSSNSITEVRFVNRTQSREADVYGVKPGYEKPY
ncbi:hypothetical protein K440DRAFT_641258 [Wilcoxina mikolae CBS 423.85]|nr:hypothetical protein K440DRAFT_641258 [Wilcoxina mikolae CBS 423.85]